ncbi:MAG: ABC-2 family transporter protein [Firmicutes bacterium]|nr:ABC-2 family transporter protein [Bacillota bacterium]
MKKNLKFILLLIKYKLSHMMMFRLSFFGVFFADGTVFLVQLLAFEAIYSRVDSIGGWSRGQMIIFVGTFSIINALNMLIYFFGIVDIPGKIKRGDLDQYLTKPFSPLLRLTFESVNPGSLPLVAASVLIVCYGVSVTGTVVSVSLGLAYAALVLLMTLLWYDMELILRTIPFLVISVNGIMQLEELLIELNFKIPGVLYKGMSKAIFYFILPYGIMSTVPTQLLSGALTLPGLAQALGVVVVFTVFALCFWRFGLRHYQSASS